MSYLVNLSFFQKEAIENWTDREYKGIILMPTGAGKTVTSFGCIESLIAKKGRLAIVITYPDAGILQTSVPEAMKWMDYLEDIECKGVKTFGSYSQWKVSVSDAIQYYNKRDSDALIIFTTQDTFSSKNFRLLIQAIESEVLLIVDEIVLGTFEKIKEFMEDYEFRLGLAQFENKDVQFLKPYFGDIIFQFSLRGTIFEWQEKTIKQEIKQLEVSFTDLSGNLTIGKPTTEIKG